MTNGVCFDTALLSRFINEIVLIKTREKVFNGKPFDVKGEIWFSLNCYTLLKFTMLT